MPPAERRRQRVDGARDRRRRRKDTHHNTRTRVADKVQLAVHLPDVVPLRSCGPEERDHVVVLILQLKAIIDGGSGQRPEQRMGVRRHCARPGACLPAWGRAPWWLEVAAARGKGATHDDVVVLVVRRAPAVLVAVWAVEYPPVLVHAARQSRARTAAGARRARAFAYSRKRGGPDERGRPWGACSGGSYQTRICAQSDRAMGSRWVGAHLADNCTSEATVWRPFEFRDAILLVRTDGSPERRHALSLAVRVGLGRAGGQNRGCGACAMRRGGGGGWRTWKR